MTDEAQRELRGTAAGACRHAQGVPGDRPAPGYSDNCQVLTFGIEEEYLLLDAGTGLPVPAADAVCQASPMCTSLTSEEVQRELLQVQLEVATPICESLDEAGGNLLRLRHELSAAAETQGCRLVAVGAAPLLDGHPPAITPKARYNAIYDQAPQLANEQLINGLHVHVAVPDHEMGVFVANRLRRWLPVLLAMSGNSPVWDGHDSGFASWRTVQFDRWPVAGPPPHFLGVDDYETRVEALLATGIIRDRAQLYWHTRISERYPTVEVRVADMQLRVDDSIMIAGLIRALVARALQDERDSRPFPVVLPEVVRAASWQAARHGLSNVLLDCSTGSPRDAGAVVGDLVDHVSEQLCQAGDETQVAALVQRLLDEGTGAQRQRQVLERDGMHGLLDMLARETVATWDAPHS